MMVIIKIFLVIMMEIELIVIEPTGMILPQDSILS